MDDQYRTIEKPVTVEVKIKRSRFIASVQETITEEDAKSFIQLVSQKHRDASHNCYAYKIRGSEDIAYYSDAGEPTGSAGRPIYGVIQKHDITNVCIVVTRYFGGKKLGIRGLIEAYGGISDEAIKAAGIVTKTISDVWRITCEYAELDRILSIIARSNAEVRKTEYSDRAFLEVAIRQSQSNEFYDSLQKYDCTIVSAHHLKHPASS
jgi:uncharacterized YigZ family protein